MATLNFGNNQQATVDNTVVNNAPVVNTTNANNNAATTAVNPFKVYGKSFFNNLNRSKVMKEISDVINEIMVGSGHNLNHDIIMIDASQLNVPMSAIVITVPWTSAAQGKNFTLAYPLLLEETLKFPVGLNVVEGGTFNQQKLTTIDDYIDYNVTIESIKTVVADSNKTSNTTITIVGCDVLPRYITAGTIADHKEWFAEKIYQIGETCAQIIEYFYGDHAREHATIKDFIALSTDVKFALNTDTSGMQMFDEKKNPVRCDIVQNLSLRRGVKRMTDGGVETNTTETIPLSSTYAYIDFVPFNADMGNMFGRSTKMFAPTYVITGIRSQYGVMDIDTLANSLVCATAMHENNAWMEYLMRQNMNSSAARIRDVGVLPRDIAIELQLDNPTVIDTQSPTYNYQKHVQVLNNACLDNLTFAIELPRLSNLGSFRDIIRNAINVKTPEYQALVNALNKYTNGHFPLDYNKPMFAINGRPVLYGSYQTTSGTHDLRDYQDYLTFSTQLGDSDPALVREFKYKMYGTNMSYDDATTWLYNRLTSILGTINVTCKGDRYDINPEFMADVVTACKLAGMVVSERTSGNNFNANYVKQFGNTFQSNRFGVTESLFQRGGSNIGGVSNNYGGVGLRLGL